MTTQDKLRHIHQDMDEIITRLTKHRDTLDDEYFHPAVKSFNRIIKQCKKEREVLHAMIHPY